MKLCATCHRAFPDDAVECPSDGATLRPDPLLGSALGPFAVREWLAEGGLGIVYKGEHSELHRPVAIKLLKRELMDNEDASRRFVAEAKAVAQIAHPHLIDVFDIGTTPDGRVYYVMELLEGRTLADRMRAAPLSFAEIALVFRETCEALEAAHAQSVVHRDLKPANIFIVERAGEPPFVKVLDFGIAKILGGDEKPQERLTRTGHIVGTPQYMAPEQIDGSAIDARVDIYALGVILYELATGALPFVAETVGGLLKAHMLEQPPRFDAARLSPGVPAALEPVVLKALRKDPNERYAQVRYLREDVERVARGEPSLASGWWQRMQAEGKIAPDRAPGSPAASSTAAAQTGRTPWIALSLALLAMGVVGAWIVHAHRAQTTQTMAPTHARKTSRLPALHSQALGVLTAALKDGDPALRVQAIAGLVVGRDARHRTLIEPLLDDADLAVRAAAASALASLGARASMPALTRVMGTPPRLDPAVAEALYQLGDAHAARLLRDTMLHGDDRARLDAALALAGSDVEAQRLLERRLTTLAPGDPTAVRILSRLARTQATARQQLEAKLRAGTLPPQLAAAETLAALGDDRGRARLVELAADGSPARLVASRALAALDDQSGFDLFERTLTDEQRPVAERVVAAQGLGASGEKSTLELLAPLLDSQEPALRLASAGAVLGIWRADPNAIAAQSTDWATSALGDESWTVREQAVTVLADAEPSTALPLLGKALHDSQPEVRRAAARSLGHTRSVAAVALLGEALTDSRGDVRMTALRSLGASRQDSARQLLVHHLDHATSAERVVAAGQLVKLGDRSHVGELQAALGAPDPELRRIAVEESLGDVTLAHEAAATALGDKIFDVRLAAALELARHGSKDGVAILQEAVRKPGSLDGVNAWMALGHLGIKPAIELSTESLLGSPDAAVRLAVVDNGGELAPAQAATLFERSLGDSDWRVRLRTVEGIDELGDARLKLSLFKRALDDPDGGVRAKAGLLYAKAAPSDDNPRPPSTAVDLGAAADLSTPPDAASAPPDLSPPPATHEEDAREEGRMAMTSAEIALKSGRYDAAIRDLQRARKLDPRLPIYFSLGEAYRKLGDNEAAPGKQREAYVKAIAAYQKAPDKRARSYAAELQERLK